MACGSSGLLPTPSGRSCPRGAHAERKTHRVNANASLPVGELHRRPTAPSAPSTEPPSVPPAGPPVNGGWAKGTLATTECRLVRLGRPRW